MMIKEEDDNDSLLFFLFSFEFTFMRLIRKGKNRTVANNQRSNSNIRGIIVCGSCGDRTTATERES